jgi:phage-related protein
MLSALPRLRAVFFVTACGREPVRNWLRGLHRDERRQIGIDIAYVQFKWPIGKPRVDHLRGPIWEVRTTLSSRIARVLFAVKGDEMILLHGFIKQTQKTPTAEVALAAARWKEWQDAEQQ